MLATVALPAVELLPLQVGGVVLLWWAVAFFVFAVVAAVLGFGEVAGLTMDVAKWLVIVFLVLAVVALIL